MHATLTLCATAIILSVAGWTRPGMDPFVLDARAFAEEPWRLVSAQFLHANILHLWFNLSWIYYLGRELEQRLGERMLLGTTLFIVLGTSAAVWAFDRSAIGLSGVVYGLWSLCFVGQRRCPRLSGILNPRANQMMIVWFFICIYVSWAGLMPISNWGHGAGAALGALVGLTLSEEGLPRPLAYPLGSAVLALLGAGATVFWPKWNFGGAAVEFERRADAQMKREDWTAAESALRRAVEVDSSNGDAWWNLGYALDKLGRAKEAAEACYRSYTCGKLDTARVTVVKSQVAWLRDRYDTEGDKAHAFDWSKRLVEISPEDRFAWRDLERRAKAQGDAQWSERAHAELAKLREKR